MKQHNYYVYITTNPKRTVLYTGLTNDLARRMAEHLENKSSFVGKYFCYNLIYYEQYTDIRVAIAREKQIKGWTRDKKEVLIAEFNPTWRFLNREIVP